MLLYPKLGMAQGDDGVYDTAEGDGSVIMCLHYQTDTVYIKGTGDCVIWAGNSTLDNPFNSTGKGGGGTPKYTFPPGATYPDIYALCADDYITDEDVGLTLKYTFDNSGRDKVIRFFAVNTTTQAEEYIFRETSGVREYESATLQVTDPTTGEVQVTYHWHPNYDPSDHRTTTRTYTYGFLVGFGTNGHTYSVEDSGY